MLKKFTLDNGIRVVCEKIPYLRSISIGLWVGAGSVNENSMNNGISHFIEHMLFKGTQKRTAKDIASCIDNIGGQLNAFTGKEYTCYYTKTLDSHIEIALDLLWDMYFNSLFNDNDITLEKQVIMEEINMYEDTPEELVHDLLSQIVWDGDPLGYPILGSYNSLMKMDREIVHDYLHDNYNAPNTVIAVAGNFEENKLFDLISKYFRDWKSEPQKTPSNKQVKFISDFKLKKKDTEQVHMCIGFEGVEHGNDDIYPLLVINNIFGGSMSSRLFQRIREEKGLVYSIYSYPSSYKNTGLFTIYAGMNPEQLELVVKLIIEEVVKLITKGVDESELSKSKEQLKGNYMLGLESTNSRMNSIGKSELLLEYILTPEEILEKINQVNMDSVNKVIKNVFNIDKVSLAAVGGFKKDIDLKSLVSQENSFRS
ncbi:MAG TPA: insulinase family protein [Clostridiaceae bacterium]|jgi:predicted Zn-dependent peptidase|nr:insulinase family protein [Clostridiaceae bacterium]